MTGKRFIRIDDVPDRVHLRRAVEQKPVRSKVVLL